MNKLLLLSLFVSYSSFAGVDHLVDREDRLRHTEVSNKKMKTTGNAVAIIMMDDKSDLYDQDPLTVDSKGFYTLKSNLTTIREEIKTHYKTEMCTDTKFVDLTHPGFCTAFLISETEVMTAGHCIRKQMKQDYFPLSVEKDLDQNLDDLVIYFSLGEEFTPKSKLDSKRVFKINKLVAGAMTNFLDYAVLKLDRPVKHKEIKPLKVNMNYIAAPGDEVTVIGHPMGLPLIHSAAGKINGLDPVNPYRVQSSSAIFGGNSGGPLILNRTNEVIGVVSILRDDKSIMPFSYDEENKCVKYSLAAESSKDKHAGSFLLSHLSQYTKDGQSMLNDAYFLGMIDSRQGGITPSLNEMIREEELVEILDQHDFVLMGINIYYLSGQTRTLEYFLDLVDKVTPEARAQALVGLVQGKPMAHQLISEKFPEKL